jgi:hypothetical protein
MAVNLNSALGHHVRNAETRQKAKMTELYRLL